MSARGWVITAVAVLLAGSAVTAAVAFRPAPAAAPPPVETSTATVERTDLVETHTIDGLIGYGTATALAAQLAGTITAVPRAGATLGRGDRLYAVDNRPVLLLIGSLPAYRELSPGVRGRDVLQLERNLRRLGYDDFDVDRDYTYATAAAVRDWQEDNGLVRTGVVELGRVVLRPDELRVDSVAVTPGQSIAAGGPVLSHTPTERIVTADLEVASAGLARVGATVAVSLPQGARVAGRVSAVGTTIEAAPAEEPGGNAAPAEPTVALTITIAAQDKLGSITGSPVEIRLTGEERKDVLTVPVAALLALREGGYGVEVIDGARRDVVPVSTGMFAAGRVEIEGTGIAEGTVVGTAS